MNSAVISFEHAQEEWNTYTGSERKKRFLIDGEYFMVKFPDPVRERRKQLSYMNNQFSEYVGCHIYESVGIPVQKTFLGRFEYKGQTVIAVACRDFLNDGFTLYPIQRFIKSNLDSQHLKESYLSEVYETAASFNDEHLYQSIISHFWKMMIIDCLIANYDRHYENWGMFLDKNGHQSVASVYDCGSGLHPLLTEDEMEILLNNLRSASNLFYHVRTPFTDKDTRHQIMFADLFVSPNPDLVTALLEIFPKINLAEIYQIIENTPFLSSTYKRIMIESIKLRYNRILLPAYLLAKSPDATPHERKKEMKQIKSNQETTLN